jgi:hypothetical protein
LLAFARLRPHTAAKISAILHGRPISMSQLFFEAQLKMSSTTPSEGSLLPSKQNVV